MTDLVEIAARAIAKIYWKRVSWEDLTEETRTLHRDFATGILSALREAGAIREWRPISEAKVDGREILGVNADGFIRVCSPKRFPRPIVEGGYVNGENIEYRAGDTWHYFRDDVVIPGHTWSMEPTHFQHLPHPPEER